MPSAHLPSIYFQSFPVSANFHPLRRTHTVQAPLDFLELLQRSPSAIYVIGTWQAHGFRGRYTDVPINPLYRRSTLE